MVKATIFLRYIKECIKNCEKNGVKPNTVYMSNEQLSELEKVEGIIEINKEKGNKRVFGLDIINANEDIFSVGYCATGFNRFLKF